MPSPAPRRRLPAVLAATLLVAGASVPVARAEDPRMHFDDQLKVENVCFSATNPGDPQASTIFGRRFTDGPVTSSTPVIVLAHGIASSADNWDFSPDWSVARGLAAAGYVVIAYDRLGYARSVYDRPGGGFSLTTRAQRDVLHQIVGAAKTGGYSTTASADCSGARQPSTLKNPTAIVAGHSAGGWIVAGYPGTYHDVAAMIQTDITGSSARSGEMSPPSKGGGFTPDPSRPDYFQFFQTTQNCLDFNVYAPGQVKYAVDIACKPPFLASPYGEIADIGAMYAENDAAIKDIGPSTPVLLTSGDHDSTAPPPDAKADFEYYKANCGCDVSQWIVPDTAHLFMVHASLAAWLDRVQGFLTSHGLPPTGRTTAAGGGSGSKAAAARRRSARGLTARVTPARDHRRPYRFSTGGKLLIYTGTAQAQACAGKVTVQVRKGRRTISTRRVKLRQDCSYRSTVTFKSRTGTLRFLARFGGNALVRAVRAKTRTARAGS